MTSRRGFLGASGAALAVVASAAAPRAFVVAAESGRAAGLPLERLDTWLRVGGDGTIDVFTGKVEIGMGVITGLTQIVAEELDVPMERVRMTTGDTARTPDQGGVGGSTSTQLGARPLRNAAAEARRALVAAAAQRFGVDPAACTVEAGVVRVSAEPARSVTYGELVDALAGDAPLRVSGDGFALDVRGAAKPKDPGDYTLVGKPVARIDVAPKTFGAFRYAVDVRVPDMLHARVVRPPAAGARVVAVDAASLHGLGDARAVRIGDLVAVVARREWDAVRGARALRVRWNEPAPRFPAMHDLAGAMWSMPVASRDKPVVAGDVDAALGTARVLEAAYAWPFQAHATMGPGCAVADVRGGGATIWCGAQKPHALVEGIADLLQISRERVRVIFVEDAGSYGRAGFDDAAGDAALISRAIGRPVRVQWMRHDMTQWGPKAPAMVARVRGAVRDGAIAGLDLTIRAFNGGEISSHPDSAGNFLGGQLAGRSNDKPRTEYAVYGKNSAAYAVGALRATAELVAPLAPSASPLRTTHLRDPEGPGTTFIVESFIDELAAAAGADAIAFRVRNVRDPRHAAVLRAVAEAADWKARPSASARGDGPLLHGRGVAFATRGETIVATVAEVTVDRRDGRVRVTRMTCAHDCGLIVNPRSLRGTIEANLMQSLSRTLYEAVAFDARTVTSTDWATYPVLRTTDLPERVDVILLDRRDRAPAGAGEPSSRPTAAAVANAVFDATGVRVRTAPLTPANVLAALRA